MSSLPVLIGLDEFPVGYSLAGCPPAVPASASPTSNDSQQPTLPYNDFSANGNSPLNFVSQPKGALHLIPFSFFHLLTLTGLPCMQVVMPWCSVPVKEMAVPDFGALALNIRL